MKIKETLAQCATCAVTFRAPIVFGTTEAFDSASVQANQGNCPNGHMTVIDKDHMAYRLEDGTIGGAGKHFKQ